MSLTPPSGSTSTMSAKKKALAVRDISPVLFFTDEGLPMEFYVRPGLAKQKLGPLIIAGGGLLSKAQQANAILLVDPEERSSIPKSSVKWYVSTQYIYDCVDKEAQLDLEDYRFNPEEHTPSSSSTNGSLVTPQGRMKYTPEEDAAILKFMREYKGANTRGNRIWQHLESKRLTSHSWQSMKDRYIRHISKLEHSDEETLAELNLSEDDEAKEEEETTAKEDGPAEDVCTLALSSDEEDLSRTKMPVAASERASEDEDTQIPCALQTPEVPKDPPEDKESAQSPAGPAESDLSMSLILGCPKAPAPESSPGSFTPTKSVVTPVRRSSRRHLPLDATPPKKLRSLFSDLELSCRTEVSSPQDCPPQTRSVAESTQEKHVEEVPADKGCDEDQVPCGESHGRSGVPLLFPRRIVECRVLSSGDPGAEAEAEEPAGGVRKPGILELATQEFGGEDEMEPMEEDPPEAPPLPRPAQSPAHADPPTGPGQEAASTTPPSSPPSAAQARPIVDPVLAFSEAHLFIFQSESQTESQPGTSVPPAGSEHNPEERFQMTQVQLDEDVLRIRELMKEAGQDLVSVTKALLQTSGDFSAALGLLLDPGSAPCPLWTKKDDQLLQEANPLARSWLLRKYGEQRVAQRILFLEVEG